MDQLGLLGDQCQGVNLSCKLSFKFKYNIESTFFKPCTSQYWYRNLNNSELIRVYMNLLPPPQAMVSSSLPKIFATIASNSKCNGLRLIKVRSIFQWILTLLQCCSEFQRNVTTYVDSMTSDSTILYSCVSHSVAFIRIVSNYQRHRTALVPWLV